MSLQYVVYDYWDYGYAEGDAILEFGSASVTAQATVTSDVVRIRTSSSSVTGNAAISAQGTRIQFGDASINAAAIVTADGIRIRTGIASITGTATVTALGGVVYSASGAINGVASVSASPNAIWAGNAAINGSVTFVARGNIIGDEWADTVPGTNTWFSNSLLDPYVEINYWDDGYADDRYDYWIKTSSTQDNWVRQ